MKTIKQKMIKVLRTNIPLWNRYIRFCRNIDSEWFADLTGADLRGVNLSQANLNWTDLTGADLTEASLRWADLRWTILSGAILSGADLDFSVLHLSCNSLKMQTDQMFRKQIAYHFASLIKHGLDVTDEEKAIFEYIKDYANGFHRTDVEEL